MYKILEDFYKMKKRLLCLIIAVLMLCTVFLTSCSDSRTEDEIMADIVSNSKDVALTFTVMIPTDADTTSPDFQARLSAVEEAINVKLRQDCTQIKLIAVNDAQYDKALRDRMAQIQNDMPKLKNSNAIDRTKLPSALAPTLISQNKAGPVYLNGKDGEYTIKLLYPEINPLQCDIILIRNEEDYKNFYNNGQLVSWKADLDISGKYNRINKIVDSDVLNQLKVEIKNGDNKSTEIYGIPNNHLYSNGEYKFMLINKDVAGQVSGFDIKSITNSNGTVNYTALEAFLTSASKLSGVVALNATMKDAPVSYWGDDDFSLVGSGLNGGAPSAILDNSDYVSFVKLLKKFNAEAGTSKVAVSYLDGTYEDIAELEEDYYVVKVGLPTIEPDAAFDSLFAVTDYSVNYNRAKEIVYILQTDEEIRTLLQYGIKDEDYDIVNGVLEMTADNDGSYVYKMNPLYTGNGYLTYVAPGTSMEYWDAVKTTNYDAVINTYSGFETYFNSLSNKSEINAKITALNTFSATVLADIEAMTLAEFEAFITEWNKAETTNEDVLAIKNSAAYKDGKEALTTLYSNFLAK